jgi:hypothetical protein
VKRIYKVKDWGCGTSDRMPAEQAQVPEFEPQCNQKRNMNIYMYIYMVNSSKSKIEVPLNINNFKRDREDMQIN